MAHHHDNDHICAEVVAADEASAQRRDSVASLVSRIGTSPTLSPRSQWNGSWNRGPADSRPAYPTSPISPFTRPFVPRLASTQDAPEEGERETPTERIPSLVLDSEFPLEHKSTWTLAEEKAGDGIVPQCKWYFSTFTWSRWAAEDVSISGLVPALVVQALATGILDATTYADFQTFASNQTGNCIVLTLAAVRLANHEVLLTGISFAAFIVAAFIFGQLGHYVGVRRRAWLIINQFFQVIYLVIAAVLISPAGPRLTQIGARNDWAVIMLFAAMSGQQVAMAHFVADAALFAPWNDPRATSRNRRIWYVVTMIGGSFIGAVLHKYTSSWPVVVLTLALKMITLFIIALAKPD